MGSLHPKAPSTHQPGTQHPQVPQLWPAPCSAVVLGDDKLPRPPQWPWSCIHINMRPMAGASLVSYRLTHPGKEPGGDGREAQTPARPRPCTEAARLTSRCGQGTPKAAGAGPSCLSRLPGTVGPGCSCIRPASASFLGPRFLPWPPPPSSQGSLGASALPLSHRSPGRQPTQVTSWERGHSR